MVVSDLSHLAAGEIRAAAAVVMILLDGKWIVIDRVDASDLLQWRRGNGSASGSSATQGTADSDLESL